MPKLQPDLETSLTDLASCLGAARGRYRKGAFSPTPKKKLALPNHRGEQQFELAELMTREMGKPISQSEAEIEKCAWACEYFASAGEDLLEPRPVATDARQSHVRSDPLGIILAIMPWNFPYWQVFRAAVPALTSGNVMVLKHASSVSGVALRIQELFQQAEFPPGLFSTLLLSRKRTEELVKAPLIRGVTLTGSERAGRSVAAIAGQHIKPTVLELGGSDPFIVLADADLSRVIPQAVKARMQNSGQSCIAAKRFLVDCKLAADFEEAFIEEVRKQRVGDPLLRETDVGPLAREDLRDQLHQQVSKTIHQGGQLRLGGEKSRNGFFYEPTILSNCKPGMAAFDEETFGPVAAIAKFENIDEAISLANSSEYGLGASVWTKDLGHAEELVPIIEAGAVFVNEVVKSDPRIAFGGIKNSGYGRELGREGLLAFTNQKTVWLEP